MQISELLCPGKGGVHYARRRVSRGEGPRANAAPTTQSSFPRAGMASIFSVFCSKEKSEVVGNLLRIHYRAIRFPGLDWRRGLKKMMNIFLFVFCKTLDMINLYFSIINIHLPEMLF